MYSINYKNSIQLISTSEEEVFYGIEKKLYLSYLVALMRKDTKDIPFRFQINRDKYSNQIAMYFVD